MKRTAGALAVAVMISIAVSGMSRAAPIAPLNGVQAQLKNIAQIYWYHHRWYPRRYWHGHWSWRPYPYWVGGAYPSRYYWDPRPYWGSERSGWWSG
jgi:hypothetical protein